jgi:hypothetical protein
MDAQMKRPATAWLSTISFSVVAAAMAFAMGCSSSSGETTIAGPADASVDAPVCGPGTTNCAGRCVDTTLDSANCGACNNACGQGQVCSARQCGLVCLGGTTKCGNRCVDTQSDPDNCGACSNGETGSAACGAGQVCSAGVCQTSCGSSLVNCGGKCVDPASDRAYCGATNGCGVGDAGSVGAACAVGQVCSAGTCQLSCQAGLANCNGTCINPLTDRQFCGASTDCGADGGTAGSACALGQVCSAGTCQLSCQIGRAHV